MKASSAYIRFANFDASALRLEIFSYVLTRDSTEFVAIREDLLLRIIDIVEKSGTGFAFPSQTLYLSRDSGLDKEKASAAEQQVQQWREQHNLPFPDFAPADKSAFRGSIVYPEPESAVVKPAQTLTLFPDAFPETIGSRPAYPRNLRLCGGGF